MDYEDMDRRLKEHSIRLAILCSPHNPTGRVWERWELEKAMKVYAANDCFVLSDEIWSDLILLGYRHIPTLSVSDDARRRTAAFYAPSKTFSLAGLIGSYHIIPDPWLRDRVTRQGDLSHYNSCNVLSLHALLGAYSDEGAQWLDELRPCWRTTSAMPAISSPLTSPVCRSCSRREPICCFWTVPHGCRSTI